MHLNEDDLVLHYYGELDEPAARRAAEHLEGCGGCRASLVRLQRVLAAVEAVPGPALPEGFERTVWARLEPELPATNGWHGWFQFPPARLALVAAVLALVTGAFFAGRMSTPEPAVPSGQATTRDLREQILLLDLNEHLDRSQSMLVELVAAAEPSDIDMSFERARAEDLVAANRLYRQTAAATGDRAIGDLLDDLERLLVDLAAGPDQLSAEDMETVRERIEGGNLLFKVRVLSTAVRERQQEQIRRRAAPSS